MQEFFLFGEGDFGCVEIVECSHDLVVHSHSRSHLTFWLGGGSAYSNICNRRINYSAFSAIGIDCHVAHDLCLDDQCRPAIFLKIYLNPELLDLTSNKFDTEINFPNGQIFIDKPIQDLCWKLLNTLNRSKLNAIETLEESVLNLVHLSSIAYRRHATCHQFSLPSRRKFVDYRLRRAMAFISQNIDSTIPTDSIAKQVGLSRSRLHELFQVELNSSPNVYKNSIRLETALKRIALDNENLTNLSFDLGFSSPGNFSRFFREHTGISPSNFRQQLHAF